MLRIVGLASLCSRRVDISSFETPHPFTRVLASCFRIADCDLYRDGHSYPGQAGQTCQVLPNSESGKSSARFWSEVLKDLKRLSYSPIPCVDGPFSRYLPASKDLCLRPRVLQCLTSDLPPNVDYGYYTSSQDESVAAGSAHIHIPYVEIRGPPIGPIAALGNVGDVYVVEGAKKPTFWIRRTENWCPFEQNTLTEHPFLRDLKACYRDGSVVWESVVRLGGRKSLRLGTKGVFNSPVRCQHPIKRSLRLMGPDVLEHPANDKAPTVMSAQSIFPPLASPEKVPTTQAILTVTPCSDRPSLRSAFKNRTPPHLTTPERTPKRVRLSTVDNETEVKGLGRRSSLPPKQIITVPETCMSTTSASNSQEHSISVAAAMDTPSRTTTRANIESLQLLVQQYGDEIKRLTEELASLRKWNAALCVDKMGSQQERAKLLDTVKFLKNKRQEDVAGPQNLVSRLRGVLRRSCQERRQLTEENVNLNFKLVEAEEQRVQADRSQSSLQDVNKGLRLALLVLQADRDKFKRWKQEGDKDHAAQCTAFEGMIRDIERNLQGTIACEDALRREKEDLQAELQDALVISEGFQREVFEERARCASLQDEVTRLEMEVKSLLSQYQLSESGMPSGSSNTSLQADLRRLESLPPGLREPFSSFAEAVYNTFSDMEERLKTETERAVSDAHAESRSAGEALLSKALHERDAAIQISQASERDLAALRVLLGRLAHSS